MSRVGRFAYQLFGGRFCGQSTGFDRVLAAVENYRLADSNLRERGSVRENIDLVILAMPKPGS